MYGSCINLSSNTLIEEHLHNYARYVVLGVYPQQCQAFALNCMTFLIVVLLQALTPRK